MGWGRTLFLGDIGNRLDIEDTERDIDQLKYRMQGQAHKDKSQDEMIQLLLAENGELKLYLASLVRLLMSKGTISQAELEAMVNRIDREDGKSDGMFDGKIV